MSDTKTKDTGVSLTYINNNYIRSDGGTPVTGSIWSLCCDRKYRHAILYFKECSES